MKKSCHIIIALIVLLFLTVPILADTRADAAWEPENDFYAANKDRCVYLSKSFYANADGGYLSVKTEPGAVREVAEFKNGEIFDILCTYDFNGEIWGITEFSKPETLDWTAGWIPMDQLLAVYDYIAFEDEYGSGFYRYSGSVDMLFEVDNIVLWTWPGSGEIAWVLLEENRDPENDGIFLTPSSAYRDSDGREWGFLFNVYSVRNIWVCLSDQSNLDIPTFNPAPEPILKQPGEVPAGEQDEPNQGSSAPKDKQPDDNSQTSAREAISPEEAMSPLVLIIILAVVLASVSILLILVFRVPKE